MIPPGGEFAGSMEMVECSLDRLRVVIILLDLPGSQWNFLMVFDQASGHEPYDGVLADAAVYGGLSEGE